MPRRSRPCRHAAAGSGGRSSRRIFRTRANYAASIRGPPAARMKDRRYGVSGDLSHLTPAAAAFLSEPNDRRIRAVMSERWVQYPRAGQALEILERLLDRPRTTRMPSIAIYGDSGMGKTMIM